MTTDEKISDILRLIQAAATAKVEAETALGAVVSAATEFAPICDRWTREARAKEPELVKEWQQAYDVAERIKTEMQLGGRWPKVDTGHATYAAQLRCVPLEQRSPELISCLCAWENWARCRDKWEALFPLPKYFYWNNATACGPNLWPDFRIPG